MVTTATTGVTVAVDIIGSTSYQRIKLVDGTPDSTTPIAATTGVPAAASTGLVVAVKPGVSVSAQVSGSVTVLGTALVSVVPGVSVTVQQGASVTIQQGASITGTVSIQNVVGITTAASVSVTGLPVWLNPTQAVVVNTIAAGFSVNALVTGPVSISAGVLQSITVMSTLVTLLGTVAVNIVAGAAGGGSVTTTAPGITATGQVMWVVGGQSTTVSPVFVSIIQTSVSVASIPTILTIVTQLGTQIVSVVPGVSVTIQQGASITGSVNIVSVALVSISGVVAITTAASVSVSGLPVWLNPTQQVVVSGLAGQSVSALVSVSAVAASIILGTLIAVSGITAVSAISTIVTILGTQIVSVASVQLQPVCICLSSTVIGSNTTMLFSVYTGATFVTTGASFWVVPAGKVFRVMAMNMINKSSAVLGMGKLAVIVGTAAVSLSVTSTVGIAAILPYAIEASNKVWDRSGIVADIAAATTVGVAITGGTTQSILGGVISGYLF